MKKIALLLIPAGLLLGSCQKEILNSDNLKNEEVSALGAIKPDMVKKPMKISFHSITDWSLGPKICTPANPQPGGDPAMLAWKGWIGGHGTHIGEIQQAYSTFETVNCEMDWMTGIVRQHAIGKITADNGDYYYYDWVAYANMMLGTLVGEVTINDGSGKFMGATGKLWVEGTMDPANKEASWTGEGTITLKK